MVWHGMVEVCEGAPVAVSGWVLTDRLVAFDGRTRTTGGQFKFYPSNPNKSISRHFFNKFAVI